MAKYTPPKYVSGYAGYGPVPDTDPPIDNIPGGDHYSDAWYYRAPGGSLYEGPSDYWLDCLTYPVRPEARTEEQADRLDARSRAMRISLGNAVGWGHGPSED